MKRPDDMYRNDYDAALQHIQSMFDEAIAKLSYLRDHLNEDWTMPLEESDKELLRMVVVPFIKNVQKEAITFLMCGSVNDYNASMETIDRYTKLIL